ncbi:hypothetical protein LO762_03085 [Actinocorallia sp. API 0066]|uniref:TetR/AcrR family transcriptional regulator n=1 Tax=Actinocorallia sp. API 0066 TaxID=2896846 RepID=UPI001E44484B|nr:hypothetical protein [Actinocorallia sp. API 0066]MCD0448186.1 hypothetical protein [Actinocorallia sp. API 0066]
MSSGADIEDAGPPDLASYANKVFEEALAGPRDRLGERLFRMSLTAWENPELRPRLLGKIRAATTSEEGAALLRDHFSALLVDRLGAVVDVPRLDLNAVVTQVVGVIMLRYVMRMEPMASASPDELVATFAPTIQRYLDA